MHEIYSEMTFCVEWEVIS